jgi:hypothetical protein
MSSLGDGYNTAVDCPPENIMATEGFKFQAWEDQQKETDERYGLMHCFCFNEFMVDNIKVMDISFEDVVTENEPLDSDGNLITEDDTLYCKEWL